MNRQFIRLVNSCYGGGLTCADWIEWRIDFREKFARLADPLSLPTRSWLSGGGGGGGGSSSSSKQQRQQQAANAPLPSAKC